MAVSLVSNFFNYNNHLDILCNTPEPAKFYEPHHHFDGFNQQDEEQMEYNSFCQSQQQQQPFEGIRTNYNIENDENFNGSPNHFQDYHTNFVDSPPDSKEAWPVDYNKAIMHTNQEQFPAGGNRKRRVEWIPQADDENGPASKIANPDKEKDNRRKVQGRLDWANDIDLDLSNELPGNGYISDSLLNFPVFKQEMPSPQNQDMQKIPNSPQEIQNNEEIVKNCRNATGGQQNEQSSNGIVASSSGNMGNITGLQNFLQQNGFDGNGNSNQPKEGSSKKEVFNDDNSRFQYVLAAATSIATKSNEESLTYLNQGQSYEIKLKKLGDLSPFRGKILKSVIKICFHERRLQYMEREQMQLWQASRPGERILDVDIPLSYGLIQVNQSLTSNANLLNTVEVYWDPMKEVGVYIKVNCISTEFTPKKHGGEKGVPFRIQVETYLDHTMAESSNSNHFDGVLKPLHAAACQIKVFKLKGADRKHKQDREKILKRPLSEQEKFQRSCECTILNDITSESVLATLVGGYSPEHIKRNISPLLTTSNNSPVHINKYENIMSSFCNPGPKPVAVATAAAVSNPIGISNVSSTNGLNLIMEQNVLSPPQNTTEIDDYVPVITKDSTPTILTQWLNYHRLTTYANSFSLFSGADLLRMSKEDLTKICGLADGIRMFNILHSKAITPRLTIFVSFEANIYHAIYLHSNTTHELLQKLQKTPGFMDMLSSISNKNDNWNQYDANSSIPSPSSPTSSSLLYKINLFVNGPNGIHVLLTDEVLNNVQDESLFHIDVQPNGNLLMKAVFKSSNNNSNGSKNEMN